MSDARAGESVVAKDGLQEKGVKGESGEALGDDQLDAVSGGRNAPGAGMQWWEMPRIPVASINPKTGVINPYAWSVPSTGSRVG